MSENVGSLTNEELLAKRDYLKAQHDKFRTSQARPKYQKIVKSNPINPAFVSLQNAVNDEITNRKLEQ